jgi:hypothetical protein
MSQGKRIILFTVAMAAGTVAVVLLVTLTSASAASVRAGTSMPTVRQAHPEAEAVPDEGIGTSTHIFTDVTQTLPLANPCTGTPGTATMTVSGVLHLTDLTSGPGAGTFQASGNETGSGVLTPADPALPSYSGQFTSHFDTNTDPATGTATTIVNIHAVGSDGSLLNVHMVEHIAITATGVVVSFDHPTCPPVIAVYEVALQVAAQR